MTDEQLAEKIAIVAPMIAEALSACAALTSQTMETEITAMICLSPVDDPTKVIMLSSGVSQDIADFWAERVKDLPRMQKETINASLN